MKVVANCLVFLSLYLTGCSSLILKPGDFAWPVESVLKVDGSGFIEDKQYYFSLNVKELLYAETQDSTHISMISVRIIRDGRGFYFITAENFKNVYVFQQIEGGLKQVNTIFVEQNGLVNPAMNQRPPYIELCYGSNASIRLTKEGVSEGETK